MQNKIIDSEDSTGKLRELFRIISISLLLIHFYGYCYPAFEHWHLVSRITDNLARNFFKIPAIRNYYPVKLIILITLALSTIGIKPSANERLSHKSAIAYLSAGLILYFFARSFSQMNDDLHQSSYIYMVLTIAGYILGYFGFSILAKLFDQKFSTRPVFNTNNETFPQEERLIENEYSFNLPAEYNLRGRKRSSWINITNPFRGTLILGTPGSGKTFFIVENIIRQHIRKGYAMFIYDFKYPDLTQIAYHYFFTSGAAYAVPPEFFVIDFEKIMHRGNPIDPGTLHDITDAAESSRTILLGLNQTWIKKQGDFWVESPINFLTAIIWFLRLHADGKYCTLAHVIELFQVPQDKLFSILRAEPQIESLISPFVTAYMNNARSQLEGQIAGATVSLGKLSSPNIYYVLSGNDFTLDINNPEKPKIVCLGNSAHKAHIYGAVLSLYITALIRQLNKRNMHKSSIIFDEFPSIYFSGIDNLLATARSNKVSTTLAVQDASQLKLHYGKEQAEVIINIVGNIISGQVSGDTAKQLAERFGKIIQDRQSVSINESKTSVTNSTLLEMAIPQSTISSLSSGEFVGIVADDPQQPIRLKKFHCQIVNYEIRNDKHSKKQKPVAFAQLPQIQIDKQTILDNYLQIKKDVQDLVNAEMDRLMNTPGLEGLIVKREGS
jgi:YWFCY protein/TraM recognition site of TraD and TraG